MFNINDKVTIHSTDELPTNCDGDTGVVVGIYHHEKHKEYYKVIPYKSGVITVFHQSQLTTKLGTP